MKELLARLVDGGEEDASKDAAEDTRSVAHRVDGRGIDGKDKSDEREDGDADNEEGLGHGILLRQSAYDM